MSRKSDTDGSDFDRAKKRTAKGGLDAQFRGYINVNLTDGQKVAFADWSASASPDEVFDWVVMDGVNVSVKYLPNDHCYMASATQRREASPNAGLVVTTRASTAHLAQLRLLFTLAWLGSGESWEVVQPVASPDRW